MNGKKYMPKMLIGSELREQLRILPSYDESIRNEDAITRLSSLETIYNIYIPSVMSEEIYCKLYLAMMRSLDKKMTREAIIQGNKNHLGDFEGGIGGSDSFTIIGSSGIGKSRAIARALDVATNNKIIVVDEPYQKIIPSIIVQCPFDCSIKSLLFEILRKVDERLNTSYYDESILRRATIDGLIGSVSQVALNHIGILVVDEIQNVVNHKYGTKLVGMLTQLINNSSISICMVGTPTCIPFFESVKYLARRSLGIKIEDLPYDDYFKRFCEIIFSYQYVTKRTTFDEMICKWLYEHCSGTLALVVSLIHDAQEMAILDGEEELSLKTLNKAYDKRYQMMDVHTKKEQISYAKPSSPKNFLKSSQKGKDLGKCDGSLFETMKDAKEKGENVVEAIKAMVKVEEVMI